ncbi:sensor histidine kinase [Albidovulum sp.]
MTRSLGFRLAFLLAMALLPLGVLSAIQGRSLQRELSARAEAAVLGRTRSAAIGEQRALEQATGAARALAVAARPLAEAAPAAQGALAGPCNAMARAIVEQSALFSFAGVYDLEGGMLCRSQAPRPGWTFPRELRPGLTSPTPVAGVLEQAEFTGRPVLYAQVPVLDQGGRPIAQAAVSVPHDLAVALEDKAAGGPGLELITFEADGTILTGSAEAADHAALLPADRSLAALASDHALSFTALSASGPPRVYAVVPLVPGQVYAMGSWPADKPGGSDLAAWMPPVVLPVLMWLVSLAVALLAAERLVTRHVRRLTATIARFARGERVVPALDTHDAPWEIAALADAFTKMVAAIIRDEEARDESLRQKEVLLREVHHRVKNNLQLITSIMNLQIRRARSGEARLLLRRVQERVMSLATVHRNL